MLVYAALAAWIWWGRQKYDKNAYPLKMELGILAPALLLHGAVILQPMLSERALIMGFGYATSLIIWLMLMLYFVGCFFIVCKVCSCCCIPWQRVRCWWRWCSQGNIWVIN